MRPDCPRSAVARPLHRLALNATMTSCSHQGRRRSTASTAGRPADPLGDCLRHGRAAEPGPAGDLHVLQEVGTSAAGTGAGAS